MRRFKLTISARGSLLVGGGNVPDGLHGAHVVGHDGRPIVPASALRGALREMLEALLRGADRKACEAGFGHEPGTPSTDDSPGPCALDDGGPCVPCRLFGGGREKVAAGARDFSSLVLGDGVLAEATGAHPWMLRPGVAVGRSHRSAAEDRLFLRRTTATGAVFVAEGWLRDDALSRHLDATVRATTHVGSGRSRGTARVDMALDWCDSTAEAEESLPEGDLVIRVTLRSPTILGVPLAQINLRDTRREVPGSALRGAVGFALANALAEPDHDAGFAALVHERSGARFGFLSLIDRGPPSSAPAGRLPLTSQVCKLHEIKHGLHDDLLDRIAVALLDSVDGAEGVHQGLGASQCVRCKGPLRGARGFRRFSGEVRVRVVTRASMERAPSSVREGALFTEVYLEPGAVFEGTLRSIPDEGRKALAQALGSTLSIGRARGAGRGLASVELVKAPPREPVTVRGERFDAALEKHLRRCKLPLDRVGELVPLTFLSPCVPASSGEDEHRGDEWGTFSASLPEKLRSARPVVRVRRFVREGSWDQRSGTMHAWQAMAAGAVYVLALPRGTHWRELVDAIDAVEREAVGERRHQGYGEVYAFDPIHSGLDATITEDETMPEGEAEQRKKLVVAAEDVMREYASHRDDKAWKVEKSQLNQLIGVCGEALCAEEIVNYLRYQASRERPSWGLALVQRTIDKLGQSLDGALGDREKIEAWRHYAVFLARAFTYHHQVAQAAGGGRRDRSR